MGNRERRYATSRSVHAERRFEIYEMSERVYIKLSKFPRNSYLFSRFR